MLRLQSSHRVVGEAWCRRHLREGPPVGPVEANTPAVAAADYLAPPRVSTPTPTSSSFTPSFFRVRHDLDPEALFVHCPVMTPTQQDQVVEPSLSAVGPVLDVMRVTETQPAAREAAPSVPVVERPADGGWNGPGFSAHIEHRTVRSVGHDDEARVTSDAPRRSRGNA